MWVSIIPGVSANPDLTLICFVLLQKKCGQIIEKLAGGKITSSEQLNV